MAHTPDVSVIRALAPVKQGRPTMLTPVKLPARKGATAGANIGQRTVAPIAAPIAKRWRDCLVSDEYHSSCM
jgi:hypothetical protein